jgi:transcriptional regulator with XRE-family HTH domain
MARKGSSGFSAERFRAAQARTGRSPAWLAQKAGVPPSDISKYAAGLAAPQPPRLAALAAALGVAPSSLLEIPADGEGLAHIRAAAGLTQAQLASRSGISLKRYEAIEAGLRPLGESDVARLAAATGVPAQRIRSAYARDVKRARPWAQRGSPQPSPAAGPVTLSRRGRTRRGN